MDLPPQARNVIQCELALDASWLRVPSDIFSLLGRGSTELIGTPISDVVHPDDWPAFEGAFQKMPSSPDLAFRFLQLRFQHEDSTVRWCEVHLLACTSGHSPASRVWLLLRDITALRAQMRDQQRIVSILNERVKELTFLHHMAALLHRQQESPDHLLQDILTLIPPAFQFPDVTASRIQAGQFVASSQNYADVPWRISQPIHCDQCGNGRIEICYIRERPPADKGPFLTEELVLLETMAELLSGYFTAYFARQRAAQSETQLRQALDHIPSTFAIYDAQLRFLFLNARGRGLSGLPLESFVGRTNEEVLPRETIANYLPLLHKAAETLETQTADVEVQVPKGPLLTASATFVPIVGSDGKLQQILSVTHDLTARKQAEEALRRSESQLRQLAENLPGAVYICANDEFYTPSYLSAAIEDVSGYAHEDFTSGRIRFTDLFLPGEEDRIRDAIDTAILSKGSFHLTYQLRHKNGDLRDVEEFGSGLYSGVKLEALQGFIVDVTNRRRAEREREIFSTLGHKLVAADRVEAVARVISDTLCNLWRCLEFSFSVRASGEAWQREVLHTNPQLEGVQRRPLRTEVFRADIRALSSQATFLVEGEPGASPLIKAPIHSSGRLLGIISLRPSDAQPFNDADAELLQRIAEASAPALERCRAEEHSRAFAMFGEALSGVASPEMAAEILVSIADQLIGWDACVVNLYDARTDNVQQLLVYDEVDGKRIMVPPEARALSVSSPTRQCLEDGPQLILRENPEAEATIKRFGDAGRPSASLMWVPVRGGAGIAAVLSIQSYRPQAYSREDLQLLQVLGNHCGNALERAHAQQALRTSEARYRKAITEAGAVAYERDYATETFTFVGEGIERITGYTAEEFTTQVWYSLIQEIFVRGEAEGLPYEDVVTHTRAGRYSNWRADIRIKTKLGEERWIADTSIEILMEDGTSRGSLGILQDITERKRIEQHLLHSALHDPLTGLANRVLLLDHLDQAIARARRRNQFDFAVLFLDLDRFKNVNDSLGHMAGDKLLIEVARRLQECIRPGDTVARFAGDEFVLLLEDVQSPGDVEYVAKRVLKEMGSAVQLDGHDVFPSASLGVVHAAPTYAKAEELLRDADNALYRAKALGKGRYEMFNISMHHTAVATLSLEAALRKALDRDELRLHYQPIVNVRTHEVSHLEALLRWQNPEHGLIPPGDFIPLAEETGLINPMGYWVIREAARQLHQWQVDLSRPELSVTVNLSARQFMQPDLDRQILMIVREEGLDPRTLKIEITESLLMERRDTVMEIIQRLKADGFDLYLDDFGTGYSSLNYLHIFPIDTVKIDRSFVSRIEIEGKEREIVRSIVVLAKNIGLGIIAEGVETEEQAQVLDSMKCDLAQGYLFSKPLPADEATAFLIQNRK